MYVRCGSRKRFGMELMICQGDDLDTEGSREIDETMNEIDFGS